MATYSYKCRPNPEHITEEKHPMGQAPDVTSCAVCGQAADRQLSRPAALIIKEGGYDNSGNRLQNRVS